MIFNSSNSSGMELPEVASLSDLQQGESAILGDFNLADSIADHLMNLGFIPGTEVIVAHSGPGGDPRVYRVDRTEVALRRDLAERIAVQPLSVRKPVSSALCDTELVLGTTDVSAD